MTAAPTVGDRVAILRVTSTAQVHPLVAQTWSRRLSPRPVLVANDGYLPGRVNFAIRGGTDADAHPVDLRALLRSALPDGPTDGSTEFAHGHDAATGGSLTPQDFRRLLKGLGVG